MSQIFGWRVIGASQRGANHIRSGSVCQDAIHWLPEHGAGPPLILSIADGHGGSKYFRSGVGARMAVDAATAAFCELLNTVGKGSLSNITQIKKRVDGELPRNIVKNWLSIVETYSQIAPFTQSELSSFSEGENNKSGKIPHFESKSPAYGSTILSVLVHSQFIVYVQMGDGDILTLSEQGEIERIFLTRLLGVETNSLSQAILKPFSNSYKSKLNRNEDEFGTLRTIENFRVHFQVLDDSIPPPVMIFLSTDGLANSYKDDDDFEHFALDIYSEFVHKPFEVAFREVGQSLPSWLSKVTFGGSGDDITLGILCRQNQQQK